MSWVDKELKKNKVHKLVDQAMKDPQFIKERKKELDAYTAKAMNSFLLISVDFLHRKMGFGQKRIIRFLEFALEQMHFAQEDEGLFPAAE